MNTPRLIWDPNDWIAFKAAARPLRSSGVKGDALWDRVEKLRAPLFEKTQRVDHAQVHEETMRFLADEGIVPRGWAPD
jgi:hypothetical protein